MKKYLTFVLVAVAVMLLATSYVLANKQYIKNSPLIPIANQSPSTTPSDIKPIGNLMIPKPEPTVSPTTKPSSDAPNSLNYNHSYSYNYDYSHNYEHEHEYGDDGAEEPGDELNEYQHKIKNQNQNQYSYQRKSNN